MNIKWQKICCRVPLAVAALNTISIVANPTVYKSFIFPLMQFSPPRHNTIATVATADNKFTCPQAQRVCVDFSP